MRDDFYKGSVFIKRSEAVLAWKVSEDYPPLWAGKAVKHWHRDEHKKLVGAILWDNRSAPVGDYLVNQGMTIDIEEAERFEAAYIKTS